MTFNEITPNYFQNELLLENTSLVGWAALVHSLSIKAPVRQMSCISKGHIMGSQRQDGLWLVFDKRYTPNNTPINHIVFALKHENIDLLILKRAFEKIPPADIEEFIVATPTGAMARRIWFFYEFLLEKKLNIEDAAKVRAVDALNSKKYFTDALGKISSRHNVINNLLGVADFCPIVRRTEKLQSFISLDLADKASRVIGKTSKHLISRASSFMLLADSRASFAIEGERPPRSRLERWGQVLLQAGKRPLNQIEIYRLHNILLGDDRFTNIGYRKNGVFLGERDHNQDPLPEFIGAKHEDVANLMEALQVYDDKIQKQYTGLGISPLGDLDLMPLDPVIQAAILAFGFVYIHPLEDGNGRLHRYLIHHVLAERKFSPVKMVFPVSSVMFDRIDDYKQVLQNHTAPLMSFIDWEITDDRNVNVTNDTTDLYRYFDATEVAEFLYECVQTTVEFDLPQEISYLSAHDEAEKNIMETIEMPNRMAQSLIMFIRQNDGKLSKKRKEKEFSALLEPEVIKVEAIIKMAYEDYDAHGFS